MLAPAATLATIAAGATWMSGAPASIVTASLALWLVVAIGANRTTLPAPTLALSSEYWLARSPRLRPIVADAPSSHSLPSMSVSAYWNTIASLPSYRIAWNVAGSVFSAPL